MREVTVWVDEENIGELYLKVGGWLAGDHESAEMAVPPKQWGGTEKDAAIAEAAWEQFAEPSKPVISLWLDHPGEKFNALEIASKLDLGSGMYGVAGALAQPGKRCKALGRVRMWEFETGTKGQGSTYWVKPEIAELFNKARHV